ncbi:hypothetical protein HWQ46_07785 [Shewanella sp. D64]|uniref:hypothetical protein n=1 Tax=unclassified Shewanella TaxID=196818 RepID=UPI0022BA5E4F|nr:MULTISPECIES: hypothetical protein [unclassified Shewanella]MEC4725445.1 hypothetical protein [Shewanella sp. D64]MEC4738738.1 hypothetical protein [Shewanella sp. E94]WBJ95030.1 hypothetical protein HWQ47_24920 [Shewanella sp. MTB7]
MLNQQKADGELLQVFGKVVSMLLILALLAILGFKYFDSVDNIGAQSLKRDHTKLINILAMVKAQWFAQGRPESMPLDWNSFNTNDQSQHKERVLVLIKMSKGGWPLLDQGDMDGCKQLWGLLLGRETERQQIVTIFDPQRDVCSYIDGSFGELRYDLRSGRVKVLLKD